MIALPLIQGSEAWIDARLALPTASQFHRIITPRKAQFAAAAAGYRNELLAEWRLGYPVVDAESGFMNRGREMEEDARAWYELQRDADVQPGGFLLTDDKRAGCSPDGLVGEDGLLEIKCPNAAKHIGFLLDGVEDDYRPQAQGQLFVSGRRWVDLVIYSPALPAEIIRVERDEEFIGKLAGCLTQFCEMLDAGKRALVARGVTGRLGAPPAYGLQLVS